MAQLVAALSDKFGIPPEMVQAMVHQKMMHGGGVSKGGQGDEQLDEGGGSLAREGSVPVSSYDLDDVGNCDVPDGPSGSGGGNGGALKAAFSAFKASTGPSKGQKPGGGSGSSRKGRNNNEALENAFGLLKNATGAECHSSSSDAAAD
jgi:hypothetical protein